jgi:hypothetical protein
MSSDEAIARVENHIRPTADMQRYERHKRRLLAILLFYASIVGGFQPFSHSPHIVESALSIPFWIVGCLWCWLDLRQHHYPIGHLMRFCLVTLLPITFPIYLLRTRGLKGFRPLGLTILLSVLLAVCQVFGFVSSTWVGTRLGYWDANVTPTP